MGGRNYRQLLLTILVEGLVLLIAVLFLMKIQKERSEIRRAAVAGSFYPAKAEELNQKLTVLLDQAETVSSSGQLKILIAPHAGLDFSGRTAAWGFKQLEGQNYTRVILLGASHQSYFDHVAVYNQGQWETPLGRVGIDEELATALLDREKDKEMVADLDAHSQEHSLEMELIFLQKVLKDFKIVPVLIGQASGEALDALAWKISQNFDDQTLLVVSSDLSHYPSWKLANKIDQQTIQAILTGEAKNFEQTIRSVESSHYPGEETAACGSQPIKVALKVAEALQWKDWQKIRYENSGDVTGDKERVVGYAAVGVWSQNPTTASQLDSQAQKEALAIARQTLDEFVKNNKRVDLVVHNPVFEQKLGAFVTLERNGQLRGCIGEFEPNKPLAEVVQEMTIAAASQDSRFSPIEPWELPEITIEISVLSPKRKVSSWQEVQLGKQGVVLENGGRAGTFLPQVATETGWSLEEFLSQLCAQKVGLSPECYKDPKTTIYVFEAQVFGE